ncbi:hypothetical protein IPM62_06165 [Candidatus Woesebacteria bacterium]|nr:MAG: hypothetical protein IPM62_06165 [Candidatus Woesebacteria bacterium]
MNKNLIIGIFLAVMILGAGGYFLLKEAPGNKDSETNISTTTNEAGSQGNKLNGKLSDLLSLGKDYTCSFNQIDESGNKNSGKVYINNSGTKLRGDFTYQLADGTSQSGGVIRDDEYSYIWTDGQGGFKTKVDPDVKDIFGENMSTGEKSVLTDDTNMNFDCDNWKVDNSVFVPPVNIVFTDLSEGMLQLNESGVGNNQEVDCSLCDQIPEGDEKNQCLTAFGCN